MYRGDGSQSRKTAALSVVVAVGIILVCLIILAVCRREPYLDREQIVIYTGYSETLELCGAGKGVVWKSSDGRIASVKDGTVTAKAAGKISVTAAYAEKEYRCEVEVRSALSPYYRELADREAKWLEGLQLSDGSFACYELSEGTARINPYFASYTALALLRNDRTGERREQIEKYLDWYFAHMNRAQEDRSGIDGTIYDYEAECDGSTVLSLISTESYDSVDSYSAVFVSLLAEYAGKYGQKEYLRVHQEEIDRLVQVMLFTLEDGYSVASPQYPYKLLMDNAEVYQGMKDALALYRLVFDSEKEQIAGLEEAVSNFEKNFDKVWWGDGYYYSVLQRDNVPFGDGGENWQEFYRFSVAQLFPLMFEVKGQKGHLEEVYQTFCAHWSWETMDFKSQTDGNTTWSLTAYAGAKMGDYGRVRQYLETFTEKTTDRAYPYYSGDSVWVVLACEDAYGHYRALEQ